MLHCLLTRWTKEATAENERGDDKRCWREERWRHRSNDVDAAPGEKSAERQWCRVGPSVNVSPYAIIRGRG